MNFFFSFRKNEQNHMKISLKDIDLFDLYCSFTVSFYFCSSFVVICVINERKKMRKRERES
jgi:hypothetical protein